MNSNEINKIATEALDLHKKIDLYKKRFTELKKKILENSIGKNSSYKIPLEKGIVRVSMRKERISHSFDEEGFKKLDSQIKDKFLKEEVVKAKLNYSLDTTKIESIKSNSEFKELNDLIEEHRKDAHFTVSFWQNKKNDPEEQPSQHEDKLTNIPNNQSFFKKWIKKIL